MKIPVINVDGDTVGEYELDQALYGLTVKPSILHQAVVWQMSRRRAGTASVKTRSEVSGGGRKPWKQKGTGRARAGSNRSPVWRHGGVVHGPKPKDWSLDFPKRMRKLAVRMALANRAQQGALSIIEDYKQDSAKTKEVLAMLGRLGQSRVLFVSKGDGSDANFALSVSNVPNCKVLPEIGLNVYDLLNHNYCVVEREAFATIDARLAAGR